MTALLRHAWAAIKGKCPTTLPRASHLCLTRTVKSTTRGPDIVLCQSKLRKSILAALITPWAEASPLSHQSPIGRKASRRTGEVNSLSRKGFHRKDHESLPFTPRQTANKKTCRAIKLGLRSCPTPIKIKTQIQWSMKVNQWGTSVLSLRDSAWKKSESIYARSTTRPTHRSTVTHADSR